VNSPPKNGDGLVLDGVSLWLAGRRLIGPLNLAVAPGEVVTLMGPSGSGKSSLLAFVCGTLDPAFRAEGGVRLDGRDLGNLPPEGRRLGILFQDDLLFPHLSVGGNLAFGLPAGVPSRQRRARAAAALAEAGLAGFQDRDPATLSGGQRARVALLRMLLSQPRALLLDEPFGRLDSRRRGQFRQLVFDRARAGGLPVLLVTHDREDAEAACGKIITIEDELAVNCRE
jgi:putative thiamine transport system ATP-binding protein